MKITLNKTKRKIKTVIQFRLRKCNTNKNEKI